jgi:LysM repeat protein
MDTISRENNNMLPVGAVIVGVIALLLAAYSAISLSKVNRTLAEHQVKVDKVDGIEGQVGGAQQAAEKAAKDIVVLQRSTQDAFNTVSNELTRISGAVLKLEEAAKKPAPVAEKGGKKGSGEPVVAGPGEYIVKPGDTFAKIARAQGVSPADVAAVNPGVNSSALKVGQKLKLPKK